MATVWMRSKLAKLKVENGKRVQAHNANVEVHWYATSRKAKSNKARPAGVNKQELQNIAAAYQGKVHKKAPGYARYGHNTFAKRSGICSRANWG